MTLDIDIGDGGDALAQNQYVGALDGTYWIDGWGATPQGGNLKVDIAAGSGAINGGDVSTGSTQTVNFTDDPDSTDPRKAVISVDDTGTVRKTLGDAMPPDPSDEIRDRTWDPAPPADVPGVVVAEVWLAAGETSLESADVRDRRVANDAVENFTADVPNSGRSWAHDKPAPQAASFTYVESVGSKIYEPLIGISYDTETPEWDDSLTPYPKSGKSDGAVGSAQGDIYVCGGRDADLNSQSVVFKYTPETDSWTTVASMPTARYDMTTVTYDGSLYLIGGQSSNNNFTDDVYRYDPGADSWTTLQSSPIDNFRSRAVALNGKIYLAGIQTDFSSAVSDIYEYDIQSDAWTQLAAMPDTVYAGGFVTIDGRVIWAGGKDPDNNRFKTCYEYHIDRDEWGPFIDMPTAVSDFTGTTVNGTAYFPFGFNPTFGGVALNQTLYNAADAG